MRRIGAAPPGSPRRAAPILLRHIGPAPQALIDYAYVSSSLTAQAKDVATLALGAIFQNYSANKPREPRRSGTSQHSSTRLGQPGLALRRLRRSQEPGATAVLKSSFFFIARRHRIQPPSQAWVGFGLGSVNRGWFFSEFAYSRNKVTAKEKERIDVRPGGRRTAEQVDFWRETKKNGALWCHMIK